VFERIVTPVLRQFEPDLLIVSAGYDAHERDPLGGMRLTTEAFAAMTAELRSVAEECCRGRIVAVTEGGYDLEALGTSLDSTIATLNGSFTSPTWPSSDIESHRGRNSFMSAKQTLTAYWSL